MTEHVSDKLAWIHEELKNLREQGLYNNIRTIESAQGAWFVVNGRRVLNLCSNNYLGLADNPELKRAAKDAIDKYGVGPAAVRSIVGTLDIHLELERELAEFKGVQATISFQSGFTANLATIPALVGKEDVIFSDELNHAPCADSIVRMLLYRPCSRRLLSSSWIHVSLSLICSDMRYSFVLSVYGPWSVARGRLSGNSASRATGNGPRATSRLLPQTARCTGGTPGIRSTAQGMP